MPRGQDNGSPAKKRADYLMRERKEQWQSLFRDIWAALYVASQHPDEFAGAQEAVAEAIEEIE